MAKKRRVKTHRFHGREYKIVFSERLDGICDQYKLNQREIFIMTKPHTKDELITIIHESLHAENWAATESVVGRVSREIGSLLWRLGYRLRK